MVMRLVRAIRINLGHRQAFDIVAAARKQPNHAGQHARFIVDQDGDGMAFDCGAHQTSIFPASVTSPPSSGDRIISLCALPDGIMG